MRGLVWVLGKGVLGKGVGKRRDAVRDVKGKNERIPDFFNFHAFFIFILNVALQNRI